MKKILSMLLAVLLIFSVTPVFAEITAKVIITDVSDGDVYDTGTKITLGADARAFADNEISHIDFYANGSKLPGSITGAIGTMTWYSPATGKYTLKAVGTSAADKDVKYESDTITVTIRGVGDSYGAITASPQIPDKAENVIIEISKYRINFSKAVVGSTVENSITVKAGEKLLKKEIDYIIKSDNDYADVVFRTNLVYDTEYTVSVSGNKIQGYNDAVYVPAYEWKFTTVKTLYVTPSPVASIVYPVSGAAVDKNTVLSAKVMFDSNVEKVEFYSGGSDGESVGTFLGTARERSDDEYTLSLSLNEGTYSIFALVTTKDQNTVATQPIEIMTDTPAEFSVIGIQEGDRIIINEEFSRLISVESPDENSIAKVVFKSNNKVVAEVDKAPFKHKLRFDSLGENKLEIIVTENSGYETKKNLFYTVITGTLDTKYSFTEDYSSYNPGTDMKNNLDGQSRVNYTVSSFPGESDNNCLKTTVTDNSTKNLRGFKFSPGSGLVKFDENSSQIVYFECDIYSDNLINYPYVIGRKNFLDGDSSSLFTGTSDYVTQNTPIRIKLMMDCKLGTYILFINGEEVERKALHGEDLTQINLYGGILSGAIGGSVYWDNVKLSAYDYADEEKIAVLHEKSEYTNLSGNTADVEIAVANTSGSIKNFISVIALYSEDGTLINADISESVSLSNNCVYSCEYTPSLTLGDKKGTKIRIFIWNSIDKLVPLGVFK